MPGRWSALRQLGRLYSPFLDPVFVKDLEGLSRHRRLYIGRMVYVTLVGLTMAAFLRTLGERVSPSQFAELGRHLFTALVTLQMGYVTIAMAHLAADLLLREARSGTLQLMLLTPLSGWRIALGKWKAVMAQASTLILAGLPPLAITAYLGGVGAWDLLWSTSISFSLAALSSSMGLYGALRSRTPMRAAVAATLTILGPGVVLLLVAGILFAITHSSEVMFVACLLHPGVAAVGASNAAFFGGLPAYGWIGSSLGSLILAQIFVMSTAGHLSISSTLDDLLAPRGLAASDRPPGLASLESRTVWESHPLLWKEIVGQTISRFGWTRRATIAAFLPILLYVCGLVSSGLDSSVLGGWLLVLTGLAMSAGADLFIKDREGRHLEVLLTLPVSNGQLVWAKLFSRICTIEGGAFLVWVVLLLEFDLGKRTTMLTLSTLVLSFILFSYVLSAAASLFLRTHRGAFLVAATLVWGALLGLPVLRQSFPGPVLESLHPILLGETMLERPGSEGPALGIFTAIYGAVAALMISVMIRRFRHQCG